MARLSRSTASSRAGRPADRRWRRGAKLLASGLAVALSALACTPERDLGGAPPTSGAAAPATEAAEGEVVARVGERVIRAQELDAWIKDRLFERTAGSSAKRLQAYRARHLPEMIDELVVAAEAARRGLSPEDLLAEELPVGTGVSDEEVRAFQEQNSLAVALFKGREADVRLMLETKQTEGARRAYLDDLSERAGVRIEPAYRVDRAGSAPDPSRNLAAERGSGLR